MSLLTSERSPPVREKPPLVNMDITPSTSMHTFSTNGISMVSASMNVMIVSSAKNRNTVTASRLTSNCHTISTPNTPPSICMNRHLGENFSKLFGFPLKIFSLFGSLSMISFARVNNTTPSKNATIQAATLIEFINIKSLLHKYYHAPIKSL